MRCINMKIIDFLLFSINLMAIKSQAISPKEQTSQAVSNGNLNKFERDCPDFWKVIQNNNLTEWTSCTEKINIDKKVTEEDVLQFACSLAKKMMMFICDKKLKIASDYFSLPEKDPICPFKFSQFIAPGHLTKELTNEEHCNKVCYDLYEQKPQCVILTKLNNFFKSIDLQINRVGLRKPDPKKTEKNNFIIKTVTVDSKPIEQKTIKETSKTKTETMSNKTISNSIKLQTDESVKLEQEKHEPVKLEPKKSEFKTNKPEFKTFGSEKPESEKPIDTAFNPIENSGVSKAELEIPEDESKIPKTKNDKALNGDDSFESDGSIDITSFKGDTDELSETQGNTLEEENEKPQTPFNQKEINANDGFLQAEDSHFLFYFVVISSIVVIGYIGFHNKNKILAYALEGMSGRRNRRRPNPARYRKLETNLEEAISSNASETVVSSVVY